MKNLLKSLIRIKSSFLLVLILIQLMMITLAGLLTKVTLNMIEASEPEKRGNVAKYVSNAIEHFGSSSETAVLSVSANNEYQQLFADRNRPKLLEVTSPLYTSLKQHGVRQFQFTLPDFKVFLRVHNPAVFGDDVLTSRPTLVECLTEKHLVSGLEQGRSGYGFRAVNPVLNGGAFAGCVELGSELDREFLQALNSNYPGKWAVINLQKGLNLTRDVPLVASLNEPADSDVFAANFNTPAPILRAIQDAQLITNTTGRRRKWRSTFPSKISKELSPCMCGMCAVRRTTRPFERLHSTPW